MKPAATSIFPERRMLVVLVLLWLIALPLPTHALEPLSQQEPLTPLAATPVVNFTHANYSVYEASDVVVLTLSINPAPTRNSSIRVTTINGTARSGSDFTERTNVALQIPTGTTNAQIHIPVTSDATFEANEQFSVSLSSPVYVTIGTPSRSTVTIIDEVCTHPEPANNSSSTPGVFRYHGLDCKRSFVNEAVGASDFYRFRVDVPGTYNIYLYNTTINPKGDDYDLYLYTATSPLTLLSQSNQYGTVAERITASLDLGIYLIRVYWYSDSPVTPAMPRYTLKLIPNLAVQESDEGMDKEAQ